MANYSQRNVIAQVPMTEFVFKNYVYMWCILPKNFFYEKKVPAIILVIHDLVLRCFEGNSILYFFTSYSYMIFAL